MQIFNLQKYEAKDFNGLVTASNLGSMYMKRPELVSPMIKQIFKVANADDMMNFIEQFPVMEVSENTFYEWMLQGQHDKNIPILDWYDTAGAKPLEPGKNGASFFVVFGEEYFEPDNIILGHKEDYHLRVKDVKAIGNNFQYEVELLTDDTNLFMDPAELAAGKRFSKDYNLSPSTLSSRGARPNFTSPFRMRNRVAMMRMEYDVPGNMIAEGKNTPLEFGFMNPSTGKMEKVWINYLDLVARYQFRQQYARMHIYGKKNWTSNDLFLNKDQSGKYALESGAGLFEQIAPGNIHHYNTFDLDYFTEVLLDMGVGKTDRGAREIVLGTGEWGMYQFHKAVEKEGSKYSPNFFQDRFYKSSPGDTGSKMSFGYGGQFTEWIGPNGLKIKLQYIPFFDDRVRFKDENPAGGLNESYRYIAMGYGGDAGIKRVKVRGQAPVMRYIPGLRDPFTPGGTGMSNAMTASKIDGYSVYMADWGGMMVDDPTKIVDFRFNKQ